MLEQYSSRLSCHFRFFTYLSDAGVPPEYSDALSILWQEVSDLLESANVLLNTSRSSGVNNLNATAINTNKRGRPCLWISKEEIVSLQNTGLSWAKICRIYNINPKTLRRMRQGYNIEDRGKTIICNEDLDQVIVNIKNEHPTSGYTYVWASLKSMNIYVTWMRLIQRVRLIDPFGVTERLRKRLLRRTYNVKNANYLWHMDANEKLVGWRFYFHGCIDGFSRRIIYVEVAHNKKAFSVFEAFLTGVEVNGEPVRVRADAGTENNYVRDYMLEARDEVGNPFTVGRSVHNVRIERLWSEVNRIVSLKFKMIFQHLEHLNLLDEDSVHDIMCLSYIFYPRLNLSLQNFKNMWNNHCIRTERSWTPNQLWVTSMLQQGYNINFPAGMDNSVERSVLVQNLQNLFPEPESAGICAQFYHIASQIIPDPMLDDGNDGIDLYLHLRRTVECDFISEYTLN